jgi:ATP-dependent helicase HepA
LGFAVVNQETHLEEGENPFVDNERVIVSIGLLKGSQVAQDLLARAEFDFLVVDEAHLYRRFSQSEEGQETFEFQLLSELSERIPSALLLTATPEQLGLETHFDRLSLLDSDRFNDYERFKEEVAQFRVLADWARAIFHGKELPKDRQHGPEWFSAEDWSLLEAKADDLSQIENEVRVALVQKLIDFHGTGRILFRNTRQMMRQEYDFFPKRLLDTIELEAEKKLPSRDPQTPQAMKLKAKWLGEFLSEEKEKCLLIAHSKEQVLYFEKYLQNNVANIKTAHFHSGLSLIARDRQAAYFADPAGAQVLLCTEIGSEGRNFEFAHHLILMDLPKKPDVLEQRIGRLDRIGQRHDINIHFPMVKGTWEEDLYKVYHRGLRCFDRFNSVGTATFVHFISKIHPLFEGGEPLSDQVVEEIAEYNEKLEKNLEEGRDLLVELNSFDKKVARSFLSQVRQREEDMGLQQFMDQVFSEFGVDVDDLHSHAQYIRPNDNMYIPHFPQLEREGTTITYDRREALEREDYTFLTWDHPMVTGITDLIISENYGNMTVATRKVAGQKKSFVELFFLLHWSVPPILELGRHAPPTLIRVLIDKEGKDFAEKWSKEILDEKLIQAPKEIVEGARKLPKDLIKSLIHQGEEIAQQKATPIVESYRQRWESEGKAELERLEELTRKNPHDIDRERELVESFHQLRLEELTKYQLRLEAMRLIL